jgi:Concanavalin A-like lectin/glucanases superfamily/Secretion system C-terminal sorting domain
MRTKIFIFSILFQASLLHAQTITDGLVLYFPFDGNANNAVSNDNHGLVSGPLLTTDRFGTPNSAYRFDGNDDIIIVENCVNLNNNNYSISWWVEIDELPEFGKGNVMFDIGSSPFPSTIPGQVTSVNNGYFGTVGWRTTSGNSDGSNIGFQNDELPEKDTWYHLTLVRSADSVKFYVNCELVKSGLTLGKLPNYDSPNQLFIGSRIQSSLDQYWDGKIDDFAIYNRALSHEEIQKLCFDRICSTYITVTDTLLINTRLTGYNPVTSENTVKIFPNPTKTFITIDAGNINDMAGYTYKIINSLGQLVSEGNFNQQQTTLSLASWGGAGTYFFQLIDPTNHIVDIRKIVLQ